MDFAKSGKWNAFTRFKDDSNHTEGQEQSLLNKQVALSAPDGSGSQESRRPQKSPSLKRSSSSKQRLAQDAQGSQPFNWIVMPDSQFRSAWIQVQLVVALYIIWVTPVRVGFNLPAEGVWFWFEGIIDLFFYVDVVLNFMTAYEDSSGEVITNRRAIAMRYLRGWFVIDLLATFPVDYILRAAEGTWFCSLAATCVWSVAGQDTRYGAMHMLRILRVFRIIWILKHFKFMNFRTLLGSLADELYHIMPYMSILELVIILLYLGHISGCFFYLMSTPPWQTSEERFLVQKGELSTWMQHAFGGDKVVTMPTPIREPPGVRMANGTINATAIPDDTDVDRSTGLWYSCPVVGYDMVNCTACQGPKLRCYSHYRLPSRYITSMYWAYTTMTTVGYGDIAAVTLAEKVWAICTMIVSGFFFSFVVGRMASVISKLDSTRSAYNEQLDMLTTFLKDTDLPRQLSRRVLNHFRKQKVKSYDRQQVLGALPFELRCAILRHLYASAIHSVPLLHRMADDDVFLTDVCLRLQAYSTAAQSFLYQRGETGGDVFILLRGELVMLDLDQTTILFRISPGTVFGEGTVIRQLEGIAKAKRTDNIWARTECSLLRIGAEDLLDLLDQYPQLADTLRALHAARTYKQQVLKLAPVSTSQGGAADEEEGEEEEEEAAEGQGQQAPGTATGRLSNVLRRSTKEPQPPRIRMTKEEAVLLDVDDALTPRAHLAAASATTHAAAAGSPAASGTGSQPSRLASATTAGAVSGGEEDYGQFIKAVPAGGEAPSQQEGGGEQEGGMVHVPSYPNAASVFGFVAANGTGQEEAAAAGGGAAGSLQRSTDVSKWLSKGAAAAAAGGAGAGTPTSGGAATAFAAQPALAPSPAGAGLRLAITRTVSEAPERVPAGAGLGTSAALQAMVAELAALRELLTAQQAAALEKAEAQQQLLAELPARLVNHLSMVLPDATQQQSPQQPQHSTRSPSPRVSSPGRPPLGPSGGGGTHSGSGSGGHGPVAWLNRQRSQGRE